ncbi:TSUP family transporter [Taylorella equigenitalis]|uniref:TSUP family transporter n=1 Tax=Taylorella equigenitalis TaxID=29575 RepID=UPI000413AB50|nr:TSUP family transporter [Taylorella equigenitalis]WDU47058.1 TSUP family transporter [Taylorella equigenitalis]
MELDFSLMQLVLLFSVGLIAGFIDSIAGGGGLITIPVLMLSNVPLISMLAVNKIQGVAGSSTATLTMIKKRVIKFEDVWKPFLASFVGATIGAIAIQFFNEKALSIIIPIVLLGIGFYYLLTPSIGSVEAEPRLSESKFNYGVVPGIGFYDGAFGPGTGSFFSLSYILLRGKKIIEATGSAKALNFASNIGSMLVFVIGGHAIWSIAIVMAIGQILGAFLGSLVVISKGATWIRPMVVVMCFLMVAKYLYEQFS